MKKERLLDRVRNKIRVMHYAKRTEEAYCRWVYRFLVFHRDINDVSTVGATGEKPIGRLGVEKQGALKVKSGKARYVVSRSESTCFMAS